MRRGEIERGKFTMRKVTNEGDRSAEFAPSSSRVALGVSVSPKVMPCPAALADRDRREDSRYQQSITAALCGDPLPGMSALDRRRWQLKWASLARCGKTHGL